HPLPTEAFAAFSKSPCKYLHIRGGIDDQLLEHVVKAPRLLWLEIHCLSGPYFESSKPNRSITDGGLPRACSYLDVGWLRIRGMDWVLSDECIEAVAGIKELHSISLPLSVEGKKRLQELRPDINYY